MKNRKLSSIEENVQGPVLSRLLKYAAPYWWQFVIFLLLVLGITVIEIYRPILTGKAIDLFSVSADFSEIALLSVQYIIVLVLGFLFNFLNTWILQLTGQTIIYNIREEVFAHIHKLSMRFFDITPVGKIVTRVTNDVEALNEMYTQILVRLMCSI